MMALRSPVFVFLATGIVISLVTTSWIQAASTVTLQTSPDQLIRYAFNLLSIGRPDLAILFFEQAYTLYALSQDHLGAVDALLGVGECQRMLGRIPAAMQAYQAAASISQQRGYTYGLALALAGLAECYATQGKCNTAIPLYEKARQLYQELPSEVGLFGAGMANVGVGDCLRVAGKFLEAISFYETALTMFSRSNSPQGAVAALIGLGECLKGLARYADALQHFDKALEIAHSINYKLGEANAIFGGAPCLKQLGSTREAVDRFTLARELYHSMGIVVGEVNALTGLGDCLMEMGLYEKALSISQEAADLATAAEYTRGVGIALWNLGVALQLLGRGRDALLSLQKSLRIFEEAGDPVSQANVLLELGKTYLLLGDDAEALSYFLAAYDLYERSLARHGMVNVVRNVAAQFADLGLQAQAIPLLEEILKIYQDLGDSIGEALTLMDLANILTPLLPARAIEYLEHALSILRDQTATGNLARCLYQLAQVNHLVGDYERAMAYYVDAIDVAERISEQLTHEYLKSGFVVNLRTAYEHLLDLLAAREELGLALQYAERSRTRTMLDILIYGGRPGSRVHGIEGICADRAVDVSELLELIPVALNSLVQGEVVVNFALGKRTVFVWALTRDGIACSYTRSLNSEELLQGVYELRSFLEAAQGGALRLMDLKAKLRELYELLIAPVEEVLQGKDTLIIVPAGPLWYVPFAALVDGEGRYLVERYTLAYAPSVASIPLLLGAASEGAGSGAVGFANPSRPDMTGLVKMEPAVETLVHALGGSRLYLRGEATEGRVRQELGVRGEEEKKEKGGKRGGYSFVVFGCHGVFNHVNPMYSFLALAGEGDEDGDLYAVETLDLNLKGTKLVMLLACETFLPAIESRVGAQTAGLGRQMTVEEKVRVMRDLAGGDEIVGLTRAFLLAGAEAVLATHWEVAEEAARQFAFELGRCLAAGLGRAEAMREAQLRLLQRLPDPWFWAPFILVGNWR